MIPPAASPRRWSRCACPPARFRFHLGRRASRHAGLPLLPADGVAAAPGRRRGGDVDWHQRNFVASAQPGRAGRGRRLHGHDHRRQVPARRRSRLSARGVRDLRRADAGAGEPLQRGRRDHPPPVDRGPRHAPGTALAVHDATIRPRPCSSRDPPIIIGAQVEAAITRAAKTGDGWLVVPIPTLDQLAGQMAQYKSARSAAKLPPSPHICRLLEVGCAPDDATAARRVAPFLIEKYKSYFSWGLEGLTIDPKAPPEQQFRGLAVNRFAVGTPEQVDRHAGRPASGRDHPPVDARELAGHGPERHPRRHRVARKARCCPRCASAPPPRERRQWAREELVDPRSFIMY